MNLLQHIAQSRSSLRKSELKVADHVLLDPAAVMHSSMADLAHTVGVSEPTIVRFCRAIGCLGFQDLKLKLAQSLAAGASFGQFAISENDSVSDFALKIFDTTLHTLMEVREKLDSDALERAVAAMAKAERVEFYGFGASGAVATDAQHKFFRLLLSAAAYSDPHMQAMSAVTLKPTDVAICISQSGRSKDLLITANVVRESGAYVHVENPERDGGSRSGRICRDGIGKGCDIGRVSGDGGLESSFIPSLCSGQCFEVESQVGDIVGGIGLSRKCELWSGQLETWCNR